MEKVGEVGQGKDREGDHRHSFVPTAAPASAVIVVAALTL